MGFPASTTAGAVATEAAGASDGAADGTEDGTTGSTRAAVAGGGGGGGDDCNCLPMKINAPAAAATTATERTGDRGLWVGTVVTWRLSTTGTAGSVSAIAAAGGSDWRTVAVIAPGVRSIDKGEIEIVFFGGAFGSDGGPESARASASASRIVFASGQRSARSIFSAFATIASSFSVTFAFFNEGAGAVSVRIFASTATGVVAACAHEPVSIS